MNISPKDKKDLELIKKLLKLHREKFPNETKEKETSLLAKESKVRKFENSSPAHHTVYDKRKKNLSRIFGL